MDCALILAAKERPRFACRTRSGVTAIAVESMEAKAWDHIGQMSEKSEGFEDQNVRRVMYFRRSRLSRTSSSRSVVATKRKTLCLLMEKSAYWRELEILQSLRK